jgi:sugar phosphate isomerase/epimerase
VDQAYELGANILIVASGPDPGEADRGAAMAAFTESLRELCADAQEKAAANMLSIAVENFDLMIDKKFLIGPTKLAAEAVQAVYEQYSNVGLTVDLSHQPLLRESVHEMVLNAVEHLIDVHVGNCLVSDPTHAAYGDKHPRLGCPGGEVGLEELKRFLESLIYAGYFKKSVPTRKPVVSFEVQPMAGERSEWVIASAKRMLQQAWAEV